MNSEDKNFVLTAIHMLRCNIEVIRGGVVLHKMDMIVDAVNSMDKTIIGLEEKTAALTRPRIRTLPETGC